MKSSKAGPAWQYLAASELPSGHGYRSVRCRNPTISAAGQLEPELFSHAFSYNALDRPTSVVTPDASDVRPTYNLGGLLESVEAYLRGAGTATPIVTDIDYDEKGRRKLIAYANGTETAYGYDELTFRLAYFKTTRASDTALLQSLAYTYDPAGNIVATRDTAAHDVYFSAVTVPSADADLTYDAIYRLIAAQGREHEAGAEVQRDETGLPIHAIPAHPRSAPFSALMHHANELARCSKPPLGCLR